MRFVYIIFCVLILGTVLFYERMYLNVKDNTSSDMYISLNRKDLTKLFKGPSLYAVKGLKTEFNGETAKIRPIINNSFNNILLLELKNRFYKGNNEISLNDNMDILDFYNVYSPIIDKEKLFWPKTQLVNVNFRENLSSGFVYSSPIKKESIEHGGKRYIQILHVSNTTERVEIDISDQLRSVNFECYDINYTSLALVRAFMRYSDLKMNTFEAVKIIPNPVTNKLEFAPNYHDFSEKGSISWDNYIAKLRKLLQFESADMEFETEHILSYLDTLKNERNIAGLDTILIDGNIDIKEDLIIKEGEILIVRKNSSLNFINNSNLIVLDANVEMKGTFEKPIYIQGKDRNSIYIRGCSNSKFSNVKFQSITAYKNECFNLPSAITFYNSVVYFDSCVFDNNVQGDDYLNIFNSTFTISDCRFSNTISDAFDSDFSSGTIKNTLFENIGNDAIDCSGSSVYIDNCIFESVSDKAISAGENTSIEAKDITISNSAIGLVSKDGSKLRLLENINLNKNDLDIAIFMKKEFYDTPFLLFENGYINQFNYLIQKESNIESKDSSLNYIDNVEDKLYGNDYGKASK